MVANGRSASAAVVARVPYMGNLRSKDFLWGTTNIAIWSTVEQGLAITAGSLATIRPLFQLFLTRNGLTTQRSTVRLTPYGNRSGSHAFHKQRPSADKALDMYRLSLDTESGITRHNSTDLVINEGLGKELPRSPNWYAAQFQKIRRGSQIATPTRKVGDGDSEKSLKTKESMSEQSSSTTQTSPGERSMQIMVERSFFVTDAERKSYVDQQDH